MIVLILLLWCVFRKENRKKACSAYPFSHPVDFFLQPCEALLQVAHHPPLLDDNRHQDALKRDGPHGIKVGRQLPPRAAKNLIEEFLVLLAESLPVLRPACEFAVDDVCEGRYGTPHNGLLLSPGEPHSRSGG